MASKFFRISTAHDIILNEVGKPFHLELEFLFIRIRSEFIPSLPANSYQWQAISFALQNPIIQTSFHARDEAEFEE